MCKAEKKRCPTCDASLMARKNSFYKVYAESLLVFIREMDEEGEVKCTDATLMNEIARRAGVTLRTVYTSYQKLRWFGLIVGASPEGTSHTGRWRVTKLGWKFARGEAKVPKFVYIFRQTVVEKSPEMIGIIDAIDDIDSWEKIVAEMKPYTLTSGQSELF